MIGTPEANRLAGEPSPYLRQHAHDPVPWYPWGEEALTKAREEDKPIFLSIGYAACHWCHVMERESFADPAIAALLQASFVAVKVDREERPDLDAVYIAAVQAMTGSGAPPLRSSVTRTWPPARAACSAHGAPPAVIAAETSSPSSKASQRSGPTIASTQRSSASPPMTAFPAWSKEPPAASTAGLSASSSRRSPPFCRAALTSLSIIPLSVTVPW